MDQSKPQFAIIGGGNGGQAFAGHLSLLGFSPVLYDISPNTVNSINQQGGIHVEGTVQGFGEVRATLNLAEAIHGAEIVMVVTPAFAHLDVAQKLINNLEPDQIVILSPGSTFGALEMWSYLRNHGKKNVVAETQTLLYACRAVRPGRVRVGMLKSGIKLASIPAKESLRVCQILNAVFGDRFETCGSVLVTSLSNINAVVHPAALLMMASKIESSPDDFDFYCDGITPSIAKVIESVDGERIRLGHAAGVDLESVLDWYRRSYGSHYDSLLDSMRNNKAYRGLKAPKTLLMRYITEDIPFGLVPMYFLGKLLSTEMKLTRALIDLASAIVGQDLTNHGRSLEKLGLAGHGVDKAFKSLDDYIRSLT